MTGSQVSSEKGMENSSSNLTPRPSGSVSGMSLIPPEHLYETKKDPRGRGDTAPFDLNEVGD